MKSIFFTVIAAIGFGTCIAQNHLNDFSFKIFYKTTSTDTLVFDSLCYRICEVELPDTANIASVHVKVGLSEGGTEILQYNFEFDQSQGLPSGLSWSRTGKVVNLGLLQTYRADLYYYEVWLENTSGGISIVRKWH